MMKLGFIFKTSPHSTSSGREGLDALLAASAYSEDISVFFIGDGVTQLLGSQDPKAILSRDYAPAYKLMELYDVENVYLCSDSLAALGLAEAELIIDAEKLSKSDIALKIHQCDKLLTF
ncbi:sulfurtransferase complex subunit TusC [Vibrio sp. JC009]|uniref:sulfurtransferase complex subunit TusC n=1 Tax=Vibrio sp. JC009 TaxID=2912314 RepID=UPI0023B0D977|nr:sulfurtransferase complex subunit TusC [Vibrio sp. JC009]WED23263.1 sulfurtransferase complex subunit TusC [Vibrio sp. JC009]